MTLQIRPNRLDVNDRFPMLGFTIRTSSAAAKNDAVNKFEVVIASDPALFKPDAKVKRNRNNFYSSRAQGPLTVARDEAVFVLPPEVLTRFIGQPKLYFTVAGYNGAGPAKADIGPVPTEASPYINLSGLSGRSLRRVRVLPSRQLAAAGYGGGDGADLEWAGDMAQPGLEPIGNKKPDTEKPGSRITPAASPAGAANGVKAAASAPHPAAKTEAFVYDDGHGPLPPPKPAPSSTPAPKRADTSGNATTVVPTDLHKHHAKVPYGRAVDPRAAGLAFDIPLDPGEDAAHGIEGPIPDSSAASQSLGYSWPQTVQPEYPQASRFVPAATGNYRSNSTNRPINHIVIHITDSGANISGPISWFQNPNARVSAHYVVGQDGEVVQMVLHNDVAWHAGRANGDSIGIEHVANTKGLNPSAAQYSASAALVQWLCNLYSIPLDREHILGHSEADPKTSHQACPNAVWNWPLFMDEVRDAERLARGEDTTQGYGQAEGLV